MKPMLQMDYVLITQEESTLLLGAFRSFSCLILQILRTRLYQFNVRLPLGTYSLYFSTLIRS